MYNEKFPSGIWKELNSPQASAVRQAILDRLLKADGHINAALRYLWNETDRGLWSAHQAMARIAEIFLWLQNDQIIPPPLDHYLPKDVMHERLETFEKVSTSPQLMEAWAEVSEAEKAIHQKPFPSLSAPLSPQEHEMLQAGLERQDRLYTAIRRLLLISEQAYIECFLDIVTGDCVWLQGLGTGYIISIEGLSVQVFIPEIAIDSLGQSIQLTSLAWGRLQRGERPQYGPIIIPAYYWLLHAEKYLQQASSLIRDDKGIAFVDLRDILYTALDAAAKAWLVTYSPRNKRVDWERVNPQHVDLLYEVATTTVTRQLVRCIQHVRRVSGLVGTLANDENTNGWQLELAVVILAVKEAFAELARLLEHQIILEPGDWVFVVDIGPGYITHRHCDRLRIDLGVEGVHEIALFEAMLWHISPPCRPS